MIYLNNFDTHTSYEEKLNVGGIDFKIPNVSYCEDVKDVHFNPYNLIKFYVGNITGTTPHTANIYTDVNNHVDITIDKGNKWYSYVLPKDNGLFEINGNNSDVFSDDIITKVIVKANISNYYHHTSWDILSSMIPQTTIEASFKDSNTSNVNCMSYMFQRCNRLKTLDLSSWNTSNVTEMHSMFDGCSSLETLDLSGWDTSKVTNMGLMFNGCSKLKTIIMEGCSEATIGNIRTRLEADGITGFNIIQ